MLLAWRSVLVWHSSLFSIKLVALVVLFVSSTICSSLDRFPWIWVSNKLVSNHRLAISLALVDATLRLDL